MQDEPQVPGLCALLGCCLSNPALVLALLWPEQRESVFLVSLALGAADFELGSANGRHWQEMRGGRKREVGVFPSLCLHVEALLEVAVLIHDFSSWWTDVSRDSKNPTSSRGFLSH